MTSKTFLNPPPRRANATSIVWQPTWADDLTLDDYTAWRARKQVGRVLIVVGSTSIPTAWYWVARTPDLPQPSGKATSRRAAMMAVERAIYVRPRRFADPPP